MSISMNEERLAFWNDLSSKGLVSGELPAQENIESPWYVRFMIGFSGWLAAIFMLGFISAAFSFVFDSHTAGIIVGCLMVIVAYVIMIKKSESDFMSQFALAISFSGQWLLVFSLELFQWFSPSDSFNWLIMGLFQAVLAWFMPNSIHRVWSAFAAATALSIALTISHVYFIQTAFIMALVAVIWLNEIKWVKYQRKITSIGYGLTLAAVYQASTGFYYLIFWNTSKYKESFIQPWVGEIFSGLVIIYIVLQLLIRNDVKLQSRTTYFTLVGTLILIFASLEMYSISVGVMIILLGYTNGNRILTGLGIISLLYYISAYYYTLHSTLLVKSQLLLTIGVLLLLASWLIRHAIFIDGEETGHAK